MQGLEFTHVLGNDRRISESTTHLKVPGTAVKNLEGRALLVKKIRSFTISFAFKQLGK